MESIQAAVTRCENVAPGHHVLELDCPDIAGASSPGQFVHLRVAGTNDPLLRRPISIMLRDQHRGRIEILVRAVGRGTEIIANAAPGSLLDVMGPLGNGFPLPESKQRILLVAGGVGVAPLIFLSDTLQLSSGAHYIRGLQGASDDDALVAWQDFAGRCDEFTAATEDGSAGEKGLVTALIPAALDRGDIDMVCTCGPRPMMARVAQVCAGYEVPCWASLEQFMGCGIGACLGCVVPTKLEPRNQRVCTDGPIFDAQMVVWEELAE